MRIVIRSCLVFLDIRKDTQLMSLTPELLADFTGNVIQILGYLGYIVSIVCGIIILISAFQQDSTAGLFCLFCSPYMIYFALSDFDHDWKWAIIGGWFGGGVIGGFFV